MSRIEVNIHKVNGLIPSFSKVATKISNTSDDIATISAQLDPRIKSRRDINQRLYNIMLELEDAERKMQKLVSFLHESMDEYSIAEEQIKKQVFETLYSCSIGNVDYATVAKQKDTKKQGLWDVLGGVISGGYKAGKDFVEGIVDLVTDPLETIENTFNAIMHPIDTYNYISKAISDSYERDVINGDAKSRAEWFSYALTSLALAAVGTKGVGAVSKTGNLSTKILNLDLLPYKSKNQLATEAGAVPYNVLNGNNLKDKLLSMVEIEGKDTHKGIDNVKYKRISEMPSEDVNKWWKEEMGYSEPPYKTGTLTQEIQLTEKSTFVRVYDGENSGMYGGWFMKADDIQGLTPSQIQEKFALPTTPKFVVNVELDAGTRIRTGTVNPLFGFEGGGQQFDLMGQRVGNFTNPRPLP